MVEKKKYEDDPPIGMRPDGTLNVVEEGSPREEPDLEDEDAPDGIEPEPAVNNRVQININRGRHRSS